MDGATDVSAVTWGMALACWAAGFLGCACYELLARYARRKEPPP